MFKTLILICYISLHPSDCNTQTARVVIKGPDATNELSCMFVGQAYVADIDPDRDRLNEYIKITCRRTTIGKGNVG